MSEEFSTLQMMPQVLGMRAGMKGIGAVSVNLFSRAFGDSSAQVFPMCESAIERQLAFALAVYLPRGADLEPQAIVLAYRVDFLLDGKLVIECDGHKFHHADAEKIAADRKRDRELILAGYIVLHFTGREIFQDAAACAAEIAAFAEALRKRGADERPST